MTNSLWSMTQHSVFVYLKISKGLITWVSCLDYVFFMLFCCMKFGGNEFDSGKVNVYGFFLQFFVVMGGPLILPRVVFIWIAACVLNFDWKSRVRSSSLRCLAYKLKLWITDKRNLCSKSFFVEPLTLNGLYGCLCSLIFFIVTMSWLTIYLCYLLPQYS